MNTTQCPECLSTHVTPPARVGVTVDCYDCGLWWVSDDPTNQPEDPTFGKRTTPEPDPAIALVAAAISTAAEAAEHAHAVGDTDTLNACLARIKEHAADLQMTRAWPEEAR